MQDDGRGFRTAHEPMDASRRQVHPQYRNGMRRSSHVRIKLPKAGHAYSVRPEHLTVHHASLRRCPLERGEQSGGALQAGVCRVGVDQELLGVGYGGVSGKHVCDFTDPEEVPDSIVQASQQQTLESSFKRHIGADDGAQTGGIDIPDVRHIEQKRAGFVLPYSIVKIG